MKTSKLKNIAWVFFALMLTSTSVFAQGWRNQNSMHSNKKGNCLTSISGLTEKQEIQIQEMEESHHKRMDALRTKRRATTNAIEKSEIRTEMLKVVEAHRNSVKNVLSAEQQKQYEQLHAFGNSSICNHQFANGGGNWNYGGRGNGNRQFARVNTCNSNANSRGWEANNQKGNGRGNGRYHNGISCAGHGPQNIDTCGFKVINEIEFNN